MTKKWIPAHKLLLVMIFTLLFTSELLHASVVVQSTRVIYPAGEKYITVQLINNSESSALVQSWIDEGDIESTPETTTAPFLVAPPITKMTANNGVQLKIHFLGQTLPQDRESVFYFNILDISPKSASDGIKNRLQLTIQTRIKLFYRPQSLHAGPAEMMDKLQLTVNKNSLLINNPTAYFMTIANISLENKKSLSSSLMLNPFSKKEITMTDNLSPGQDIDIDYIGDNGDYIRKKIKTN